MLLRDLDYFIALAEAGSFRRAATRMDVSQPAITKAIRRLEVELGLGLVTRSSVGAELTEAGAAFLKRASRLRQDLQDALREAADLRTRSQGLLRVGCAPSLITQFFVGTGAVVAEHRPASRFQLFVALSDLLFAKLRRGELDLVICTVPDRVDVAFETRPVGVSTLVVVASRGHALLKRKRLELSHLVDQPWILPRRGVLTRDWIDGIFARHGLPLPQVRFELDIQADPLVPMAAASSMLAVTSELPAAQLARAGLAALPMDELRWRRTVGALTRAGAPVSPLAQHFMDVLASVGTGGRGAR